MVSFHNFFEKWLAIFSHYISHILPVIVVITILVLNDKMHYFQFSIWSFKIVDSVQHPMLSLRLGRASFSLSDRRVSCGDHIAKLNQISFGAMIFLGFNVVALLHTNTGDFNMWPNLEVVSFSLARSSPGLNSGTRSQSSFICFPNNIRASCWCTYGRFVGSWSVHHLSFD